MKTHVIIAAAGVGKRFGGPKSKQIISLNKKPIIYYCLKVFHEISLISNIVIVTNNEIIEDIGKIVNKYNFTKVSKIILGGKERQNSIFEGLKTINEKSESIVLIHDAVRPIINKDLVNNIINNTKKYKAVIPSIRIKDTLKYSLDNEYIDKTLDRENIWAVQTPQGFKYSIILKAHENARKKGILGTDDSFLVEKMGVKPKIIEGDAGNIKITTPFDLVYAKLLIRII